MTYRLLLLFLLGSVNACLATEASVSFNRQVRRILSDKCFACHGPDERHRQADLRLDQRESALRERGGHAAIVPGRPDASEALRRVTSSDPDVQMPPPDSGKTLTPQEIDLLRRWMEQGAIYEGHWAFLPLHESPPPVVDDPNLAAWLRQGNDVDPFLAVRWKELGITPSPLADKPTLMRRLYLDLIGLLPHPDEVVKFTADDRPQAYSELVEQLLASPHYGERWGRHWLDQARYADSNGYTIDGERTMWPYRDWVIKALNHDLPFDQFTIEQLAGDLLPNATREQILATGFHRNTLINQEGGTDPEQFRIEAAMDRVATTAAVWLGLTVGCAQCHHHKFDPISQREYYQFYAFFNQTADVNQVGPTIDVHEGELFVPPSKQAELDELRRAMVEADALQAHRLERQRAWESTVVAAAAQLVAPQSLPWQTLKPTKMKGEKATLRRLDDNSLLATPGVQREIYVVEMEPLPAGTSVGSFQLRVIPHESLPQQGPGLASNGNFVLSAIEVYHGDERVPLTSACSTHSQPTYSSASLVDDNPSTAWAINVSPGSQVKMNAEHTAWVSLANPIVLDGRPLRFVLKHELNNDYNLGRFQLAWSPHLVDATNDATLMEALQTSPDKRTKEQEQVVSTSFASVDHQTRAAQAQIDTLRKQLGLGPSVKSMVMQEVSDRRPTYLLTRGDFLRPDKEGGIIHPDVLSILPPLEPTTSGSEPTRLDLARWLVRGDNPLTPRVTVNRMWMHYFGRGLVETENDFGSQGASPTHPELLDWLARQLVTHQWSLKSVHRLIVHSATYRQASRHRPDLDAVDPLNLSLARQNRLRLDAEIIRDAALTASGRLERKIGGPSVQPPQPEGVYAFTQNRKNWQAAQGEGRYRRAIYTMFYRSAPYPTLTTFDAPDFQSVCTRRSRSNTPLQALTMANDEAMVELAQGFAQRITSGDMSDASTMKSIEQAFLIALARTPSPTELRLALNFLQQQREQARKTLAGAEQASATDHIDATINAHAWTALARALMNTDEFITRE